jgi:hypothetical protein
MQSAQSEMRQTPKILGRFVIVNSSSNSALACNDPYLSMFSTDVVLADLDTAGRC